MTRAFLFNPENDIALAAGLANFTPPAAGKLMASSGFALPWWFGGPDDVLLVPDAEDASLLRWLKETESRFGPGPRPVASLDAEAIDELCPWGWSAYAVRLWQRAGAPESLWRQHLESAERHRHISHRRTAREVLRLLGINNVAEARSLSEIDDYARRYGDFYLKAPWSSSGRGVLRSTQLRRSQAEGIIRRQGSVMLEPAYDGVQDFAMLFYAEADDEVRFAGYSLFFTGGTVYGGNLLADDTEIEQRLAAMTGQNELAEVRRRVCEALRETTAARGYRGPLGVDMLVYRDGDSLKIAPCLEVNCRYTMGFVAHAAAARGLRGRMAVLPADAPHSGEEILLSPTRGSHRFVAIT